MMENKQINQDIMVSVVCTTYNHAKYIRRALESFISQITDFRYEIIVHDDASTDTTAEIILEFAEKYPNIVIPIIETENQYSRGNDFGERINASVRGKYRATCEGDDYWCDSYKLQKQFDAMEKHPECSLCVHRAQVCAEDGALIDQFYPEKSEVQGKGVLCEKELIDLIWIGWGIPFHLSSFFIRESILRSVSNNPIWKKIIHYDIGWYRLALSMGLIYYLDETMSVRRRNVPGSYTERIRNNKKMIVRRLLSDIRMDVEFNAITKGRYNNAVCYRLTNNIIELSRYCPRKAHMLFKKINIQWNDVKEYAGPGLALDFLVLAFFPVMSNCVHKLISKSRVIVHGAHL